MPSCIVAKIINNANVANVNCDIHGCYTQGRNTKRSTVLCERGEGREGSNEKRAKTFRPLPVLFLSDGHLTVGAKNCVKGTVS